MTTETYIQTVLLDSIKWSYNGGEQSLTIFTNENGNHLVGHDVIKQTVVNGRRPKSHKTSIATKVSGIFPGDAKLTMTEITKKELDETLALVRETPRIPEDFPAAAAIIMANKAAEAKAKNDLQLA